MSRSKNNWDALVDYDGNYYNPLIGTGGGGGGSGSGQKGDTGATGAQGPTGPAGAQGVQGNPGQKGDDGTPAPLLEYQGSVPTVGNLPPTGNTAGDTYSIDDGTGLYYSWDGTQWNSAGQVVKGDEGQKGEIGAQGPTGAQGAGGTAGAKGEPGSTGAAGTNGTDGADGTDGTDGTDGADGADGAPGVNGTNGAAGQKGEPGAQGTPGTASAKGEPGVQGDKGEPGTDGIDATGTKGEPGTDGAKGDTGDKGDALEFDDLTANQKLELKGQKGEEGAEGEKGQKGAPAPLLQYAGTVGTQATLPAQPQPAGDTYYVADEGRYYTSNGVDGYTDAGQMIKGDQGAKGDDGEDGDKGEKGAPEKGEQGIQGLNGDKGDTGDKGDVAQKGDTGQKGDNGQKGDAITGDKGKKGAPAPLLQYIGAVSTFTALPAQPQTAGDTYYVEDEGLYYSSDGTIYSSAGQMIKGDIGTKGDDGIVGQKGDNGQKGEIGVGQKGEQGDKGDTGQSITGDKGRKGEPSIVPGPGSTIAIGAVTSVAFEDPTTVTNVGTAAAAIFDFDIAKGEKGDEGDKGDKGAVNGVSAAGVTAHVTFNGDTNFGLLPASEIYSGHNISSITKSTNGTYTITWDATFSGAQEYTVVSSVGYDPTDISAGVNANVVSQTTTTTEIVVERGDSGALYNPNTVSVVAYGTGTSGTIIQKGEKGAPGGQKGDQGFIGQKGDEGDKGTKGLMPIGAAQAHVAFDASGAAAFAYPADVSSSFNVSNIVRNSAGNFTITWDSAFADANYTVIASAGGRDHSSTTGSNRAVNVLSRTATECQILCESGGGNNDDSDYIAICVYGTGSQGNVQTGPEGQKGEKGAPDGDKGNTGDKGDQGDKGQKGQIPAAAVTAHVSFNGETGATGPVTGTDIFASAGVDTVVRNSTGNYTVTFTTPFASANSYTVTGSAGGRDFTGYSRTLNPIAFNANACNFVIDGASGGANDTPYVSVVFYGNGATGAVEIKGDKGEIGPSGGVKGEPGADSTVPGPGSTVNVGSTTTIAGGSPAVVANSGTVTDAIFDFQIPKGEKGEDGAAVNQGDKGEPFVYNDFTTAQLQALKGEPGSFEFQTSLVAFDASAGDSFSFGNGKIASNNVSTVQRISDGKYEIFFDNNFNDPNYMIQTQYNDTTYTRQGFVKIVSRFAATLVVEVYDLNNNLDNQCPYISVLAMGRGA